MSRIVIPILIYEYYNEKPTDFLDSFLLTFNCRNELINPTALHILNELFFIK
jgi:hypothetical protein